MGQEMFRNRMAEFIKDKRLLDGFTPTFGLGCRTYSPRRGLDMRLSLI